MFKRICITSRTQWVKEYRKVYEELTKETDVGRRIFEDILTILGDIF